MMLTRDFFSRSFAHLNVTGYQIVSSLFFLHFIYQKNDCLQFVAHFSFFWTVSPLFDFIEPSEPPPSNRRHIHTSISHLNAMVQDSRSHLPYAFHYQLCAHGSHISTKASSAHYRAERQIWAVKPSTTNRQSEPITSP